MKRIACTGLLLLVLIGPSAGLAQEDKPGVNRVVKCS
jgi:hypothetical protein